jgi:predicted RNA-binding protein associated with RNAse of E/G family
MNVKTMYRDEWTRILEKKVIIKEFTYGDQKGKMSLLKIQKVTEPLWVGDDVKKIKIAEVGHSWLQIALENGFFWVTAMFDEEDKPFEIYIDMTNGNHIEQANPYFEDMYLDYAISGDRVLELDKDELEEALREDKITKEQYERTLAEGEKLYTYLKNNKDEFREFIQRKFEELRNEI